MSEGYTPRPGSFTLFKNRHKQQNDNKPDYTGDGAGLDGRPLRIAGWIKTGKNGNFMSISISEPQPKPNQAPPPPANESDDCPF